MVDENVTVTAQANDEDETPVTRDSIRAQILGKNHPPKKKIITFFGQKIELRQSSVGMIMDAQDNPDRKAGAIQTLINGAYIPDTDIKVFEDTDYDVLVQLPFGKDIMELNNALAELTEVNFRLAEIVSNAPPQD